MSLYIIHYFNLQLLRQPDIALYTFKHCKGHMGDFFQLTGEGSFFLMKFKISIDYMVEIMYMILFVSVTLNLVAMATNKTQIHTGNWISITSTMT